MSPSGGGTALSLAELSTRLAMWIPHKNRLKNGNHVVYKAIIEKSTLQVVTVDKTEIRLGTNNIGLISATQKAKHNFVAIDFYTGSPDFRHDLLAHSAKNPANSWLLQECFSEECIRKPAVVARGENLLVQDVRSVLPDGRRYYLYLNEGLKLLLQPIDGKTGKKLGEKSRSPVILQALELQLIRLDAL